MPRATLTKVKPPTAKDVSSRNESLSDIRVEILAAPPRKQLFVISIPLDVLLNREVEMTTAAQNYGIDPASWSHSRLYRMYRAQISPETKTAGPSRTLAVCPERECAEQNYHPRLIWNRWLSDFFQHYYVTGELRIPEQCRGYDVLMALEFFGIVYEPEQLQFPSYGVYCRLKNWSDYFSMRSNLGEWVAEYVRDETANRIWFGTVMFADEVLYVDNYPVIPMSGLAAAGDASQCSGASAAVVFDLFNCSLPEGDPQSSDRREAAELMRLDFAQYLPTIIPGIDAVFQIRNVQCGKRSEDRAVLRVDIHSAGSLTRSITGADQVVARLKEARMVSQRLNSANDVKPSPRAVEGCVQAPPHLARKENHNGAHVRQAQTSARPTYVSAWQETNVNAKATSFRTPSPADNTDDTESAKPPVSYIHASDHSIFSSVTLPMSLLEESVSLKPENKREEKPLFSGHEWIQESILNNVLSQRLGALLQSSPAIDSNQQPEPMNTMATFEDHFEWLSIAGVGLCKYPETMWKDLGKSSCLIEPNETKEPQSDAVLDCLKAESVDTFDFNKGGGIEIVKECKPSEVSSPPRNSPGSIHRTGTSHPGTTVKERLSIVHKSGGNRSDSSSLDRRSVAVSENERRVTANIEEVREEETKDVKTNSPGRQAGDSHRKYPTAASENSRATVESSVRQSSFIRQASPKTTKRISIKGLFKRRKAQL